MLNIKRTNTPGCSHSQTLYVSMCKISMHISILHIYSITPTRSATKTHISTTTRTHLFSANEAPLHHIETVTLTLASSCFTSLLFSSFSQFFLLSAQPSQSHLTQKNVMTQCWCFTGTRHSRGDTQTHAEFQYCHTEAHPLSIEFHVSVRFATVMYF